MAICGLCKLEKDLKDSHLIPKSIYKYIRNSFPNEGNKLVRVKPDEKKTFSTDKQVSMYFLCHDCEDKINKNGENFVVPECQHGKDKFDLLEKIKKAKFTKNSDGEKWINPMTEKFLNPDAYLYFALSIFWRNSAGSWSDELEEYKGALGIYEESIRNYLLNKTNFPENVYLFIYVDHDKENYSFLSFPSLKNEHDFDKHTFFIPGIMFLLVVGDSKGIKLTFESIKTKTIFVSYSFQKSKEFGLLLSAVKSTKSKGNLAKLE